MNDYRNRAVLLSAIALAACAAPGEACADCQAQPPTLSRPVDPKKVSVPPGSPQLATPPGPMVTVPEGEPLPPPAKRKPPPAPDPGIQLREEPLPR